MKTLLLVLLTALACGRAAAQLSVEPHPDQRALLASNDPSLAANKKLVFDFWREVMQAHDVERAPDFMAEGYVEHGPRGATGRDAFLKLLGRLPKLPVKPAIDDLFTLVAERDLVVLGFRRRLPDPENEGQTYTTTWFDMLRIENGKIRERWDYETKD